MPTTRIFYHRDYYLLNRAKIQNYNESYRKKNNIYHKIYYLNNRDKLLNYGRKYYQKNLQKCRKNNLLWKEQNLPNYAKKRLTPPFKKINEQIILRFD